MKTALAIAVLLSLSYSFSMISAKPKVVYHRSDLADVKNKVVVFPTLDFSGKRSKGAGEIERTVVSNWTQMYGADRIIPAGPVADKIQE
jgi:hypothetical protein